MSPSSLLLLILMALIAAASFVIGKTIYPVIGPVWATCIRLLLIGLLFNLFFLVTKFKVHWKEKWSFYLIVGLLNTTVPLLLFGYALLHIPASYAAVLNSTAPLFGAILSSFIFGDKLTPGRVIGLILGMSGVAVVCFSKQIETLSLDINSQILIGMLACLAAAIAFALASIHFKKFASGINPIASAGASTLLGGMLLIPLTTFEAQPKWNEVSSVVIGNLLTLSLIGSGLFFIIYYHLVKSIGPAKTLTVTFLIPMFGMLMGYLFLGEDFGWYQLVGGALIVVGIKKVISASPGNATKQVEPLKKSG